jgi:hypothetical protein
LAKKQKQDESMPATAVATKQQNKPVCAYCFHSRHMIGDDILLHNQTKETFEFVTVEIGGKSNGADLVRLRPLSTFARLTITVQME